MLVSAGRHGQKQPRASSWVRFVACNSYRNPNLLADMPRTVDLISGGRVVLGVGSGWFQRDYDEYGYRIRHGRRPAEGPGDEPGRDPLAPRAVAAATGAAHADPDRGLRRERTLRLVAEHADGWHAGFPDSPQEMEPKIAALLEWCRKAGRDPQEIEWGLGVQPDDLERFLVEDAETYVAMGFSQFTLGFNGPEWTVERGAEWLAWRDGRNQTASVVPTTS